MIKWPQSALRSVASFFTPLQDLDVYVEDADSQVFYAELFGRLLGNRVRVVRPIPLGSRTAVERECRTYSASRPALFIVDGDLDFAGGHTHEPMARLFRLRAYCIENYLICAIACTEILRESSGRLSHAQATSLLGWSAWRQRAESLLELFVMYAIAHENDTGIQTTASGIDALCIPSRKGEPPRLDVGRVQLKIQTMERKLRAHMGDGLFESEWDRVRAHVQALPDKMSIVSGKDFLIPVLGHHLRALEKRVDTRRDALIFRLARHCSLEPLSDLRDALLRAAAGEIVLQ